MTTIKIRAAALKPSDIIHEELYGRHLKFKVFGVSLNRKDSPKTVTVTFENDDRSTTTATIPWDRRCIVERSGGASEASESRVEAETANKLPTAIPEPSSKIAMLIAEAREEFIEKVRKFIREG